MQLQEANVSWDALLLVPKRASAKGRALLLRGWLSGKQLGLVGLVLPLVRIGWRLILGHCPE
jgi:hypothetical protein